MQGVEEETAQGGAQEEVERRADFSAGRTSQRKEGAGGGAGCVFA